MYSLEQFIHETGMCSDIPSLQTHWANFVSQFGAEGYRIVRVSPETHQQSEPFIVIAQNTPPGWVEHYREHDFHWYDPILARVLRDRGLFSWSEVYAQRNTPEVERLIDDSRAFGIRGGISLSLWFEPGLLFVIAIYIPSAENILDDTIKRMLQTAAFIFCTRYREIAVGQSDPQVQQVQLTPRESDVLRWIALGKTKQEVADLLQISSSSVKRHCESTSRKLGANNMASAVALAMFHGLIII